MRPTRFSVHLEHRGREEKKRDARYRWQSSSLAPSNIHSWNARRDELLLTNIGREKKPSPPALKARAGPKTCPITASKSPWFIGLSPGPPPGLNPAARPARRCCRKSCSGLGRPDAVDCCAVADGRGRAEEDCPVDAGRAALLARPPLLRCGCGCSSSEDEPEELTPTRRGGRSSPPSSVLKSPSELDSAATSRSGISSSLEHPPDEAPGVTDSIRGGGLAAFRLWLPAIPAELVAAEGIVGACCCCRCDALAPLIFSSSSLEDIGASPGMPSVSTDADSA